MSAILRTITIYQARAVQKSLNRRGKVRGKERHPIFKGPVSRLITQFASLFSTVSFHRGAMEGARAPLSHAMGFLNRPPLSIPESHSQGERDTRFDTRSHKCAQRDPSHLCPVNFTTV